MPNSDTTYKPEFPYKGNQIIISSDRVTIHSKLDSIFLFGKQAVSLSSTKTINLDAYNEVKIDSPIIQLGHEARVLGEPTVLGRTLTIQLQQLLSSIKQAGSELSKASSENSTLGATMESIHAAGILLFNASTSLENSLKADSILSKNTFTR
jgi:hypothetical protein